MVANSGDMPAGERQITEVPCQQKRGDITHQNSQGLGEAQMFSGGQRTTQTEARGKQDFKKSISNT